MKYICFTILFFAAGAHAQLKTENLIIITTDGFRWQEVFGGMDSAIANDPQFNQGDSVYIFKKYWDTDDAGRRKKLLPFFWNTIAEKGQIYGNRKLGSKVDNANPYWFSYPGYNEIMTGFADTAINSNSYPANPNITVLEFLSKQPKLKGKMAAFGAWDAFDRILNEERSGIPVHSAFDTYGGTKPNSNEQLLNKMLADSYKPWLEEECPDIFTHYGAMEYLKTKKPNVMYIAYGETDEWAHAGQYRSYLDAANQVDKWIGQLWDFIQSNPAYKNKTTLFITTDHGRGDINKNEWRDHGSSIQGANEIWCAVIGPDIDAKGEIKQGMQYYQKQFAQTFARLMGYDFKTDHPVAEEIEMIFVK